MRDKLLKLVVEMYKAKHNSVATAVLEATEGCSNDECLETVAKSVRIMAKDYGIDL